MSVDFISEISRYLIISSWYRELTAAPKPVLLSAPRLSCNNSEKCNNSEGHTTINAVNPKHAYLVHIHKHHTHLFGIAEGHLVIIGVFTYLQQLLIDFFFACFTSDGGLFSGRDLLVPNSCCEK